MRFISFAAAGAVCAAMIVGAGTAAADTAKATSDATSESDLVITEIQHGVRNPKMIAECYQPQGGDCAISKSVAIQTTINANFSVTFLVLNAQLGGSYQETFTTQVTCTNKLPPRHFLRAYPSGDFVFFEKGEGKGTAFLPTGIQCQVEER